jgi:hypothetical protein
LIAGGALVAERRAADLKDPADSSFTDAKAGVQKLGEFPFLDRL